MMRLMRLVKLMRLMKLMRLVRLMRLCNTCNICWQHTKLYMWMGLNGMGSLNHVPTRALLRMSCADKVKEKGCLSICYIYI